LIATTADPQHRDLMCQCTSCGQCGGADGENSYERVARAGRSPFLRAIPAMQIFLISAHEREGAASRHLYFAIRRVFSALAWSRWERTSCTQACGQAQSTATTIRRRRSTSSARSISSSAPATAAAPGQSRLDAPGCAFPSSHPFPSDERAPAGCRGAPKSPRRGRSSRSRSHSFARNGQAYRAARRRPWSTIGANRVNVPRDTSYRHRPANRSR